MKRRFTILTAAFALLAILATPMGMWGQTRAEVVSYTLDGTQTGGTNGYATESEITQGNITWMVTGNTTINPWRIGGKNLDGVDRPLYSKNTIADNITKVVVTNGTANLTVNSMTLIVSTNADFSNPTSTVSGTWVASSTTTFERPAEADWTNMYFKLVYNVTAGTSNQYAQFIKAELYKESTGPVIATPTFSPDAGTYTEAQNVTIDCETSGSSIYYTTDGSTPSNSNTQYTGAINVSSTTTIKAIAYVGDNASSVATATYTIVEPLTTMDAIFAAATEAGSTATPAVVIFNNWVVTGVTSSNAYVTDGTKGFIIYASSHGFEVGNVLSGTVACNVQLYKGAAEITGLTSTTTGLTVTTGGVVTPVTNISIANLSGVNTGAVFSYENLTYDGTNLVDIDDNAIKPFNSLYSYTFETNHVYNVTGIFVQYNSDKEILPRSADDIEEVTTTESSITINPTTINVSCASAEGTLTVTYQNIDMELGADIYWYESDGTTSATYDWVEADFDDDNNVYYVISANTGDARTAYMKVYGIGTDESDVYSDLVTFSQGHYIADYAELPFEFDGGRNDIQGTAGLTADGLGDDYNNSPKLRFDSTGDWVILHFNERPGTLTFDIKGNSFSGGTFTVQTSEDGETYTDLKAYTELGATQHEEFTTLGENVRYIKWIYTNKSSGNVALGNIALAKYVEPVLVASITVDPATVNENAEEHEGTLGLTYENLTITEMSDFDIQYYDAEGEEADEPDWVEVLVAEQDPTVGEGYVVSYYMMENESEARTAYFKVFAMGNEDFVYSNLVTINQAAYVAPAEPGTWVLTDLADLTAGDVFVIVGDNGNTYAMSNDNGTGSAPAAVAVTIVNGTISGEPAENIQWTINGNATDGYTFYPNGTTETWLYCTNTNNGVRVGTNENNTFVMDAESGYLMNIATSRYLGIYNSQDWRCYNNTTGNTANQTFAFYKKTVTYELDITGYGSSEGGYYLIASPVTVNPENVEGMTEGNFDLYRFNQSASSNEWENWEQAGDHYHFDLVPGRGYLYAHQTGGTFSLTGTPYTGNGEIALVYDDEATFKGWNLIGNPFGETATVDHDYYVINETGEGEDFIITSKETPVAAMQGLFVVTEGTDDNKAIFTTEEPETPGEKLVLNVSRNRGIVDRAMIRFGEGHQMPKAMLNENHTKLYIPQANNDYAVVRSDNESEMPVSFKAAANGTYTISIDADNVEMDYLHLFDNMTGNDVDLLATPSYSFEANITDYANRFKLVYKNTTSIEENGEHFAYFNGDNMIITNEGDAQLQVIDMTGRIVSTETLNGTATVKVNAAPGVYMLRLVNGNDIKTQKVIIK